MVRKGSPVRVRQRALMKRLQGRFFCVRTQDGTRCVGAFLGHIWGTPGAFGKGSTVPYSARGRGLRGRGRRDPFLNSEVAVSKPLVAQPARGFASLRRGSRRRAGRGATRRRRAPRPRRGSARS